METELTLTGECQASWSTQPEIQGLEGRDRGWAKLKKQGIQIKADFSKTAGGNGAGPYSPELWLKQVFLCEVNSEKPD